MVPLVLRVPFIFVWDFILFVLWIALFGIFAAMYIHEKPEGNEGIMRMKNAVVRTCSNLWMEKSREEENIC
jgi:hypothetical protein